MSEIDSIDKSLHLFIVYARKDEQWKIQLEDTMVSLVRKKIIKITSDTEILPGEEWAKAIDGKIMQADIILLLITSNFLSSKYCFEYEMAKALKLHEDGLALTIPVIVSPCLWNNESFAKLQFIPKDGEPLRKENDIKTEYAFLEAAKELTALIKSVYSENVNRVETFKKYFREISNTQKEIENNIYSLSSQKQSIQKDLELAEGKIKLIRGYEERIKLEEEKSKSYENKIKELSLMIDDKKIKVTGLNRRIESFENEISLLQQRIKIKNSFIVILLFILSVFLIQLYASTKGVQVIEIFGWLIFALSIFTIKKYYEDLVYCTIKIISTFKSMIQENRPIFGKYLQKVMQAINVRFKN